jgi:filamentous hemagglutinin family protein
MNHVYRLKRSGRTQQLQPVPENTRSAGKGASSSGTRLAQIVAGTLASFALSGIVTLLHAQQAPPVVSQLPQGGVVSRGSASINTSTTPAGKALMTVNQTSNRAVIDWNSFNVGASAKVQFNQPSRSAVVLNQIVGNNASQIYGQISANGQVFLSNPNGIYFSPTAQVDVGGLVATTGKANADDFMAGRTIFNRNGSTGSVVNEGHLSAALGGYIALLAPEVRNQGVIVAQAGTVALASGEAVTLNFNGAGTGLAGITTTPQTIAALVENRSAVLAEGGYIVLSAHAMASLQGSVIRNSGQLSASSLSTQGGKIVLMADSIELTATSRIDANGPQGGGTVLVGGDWQGSGDMRQAVQVSMAQGASIEANATDNGDGGKVVLWSDIHNAQSVTRANGSIKAEAGPLGGNGGQIETSGHLLNVDGIQVSTQANAGNAGEWLLDPYDITIGTGAEGTTWAAGTVTAGLPATSTYTSATTSTIQASSITNALATNNVTIQTGGVAGDGNGSGDININGAVSWAANNLTLKAHGSIYVNAVMTATSTASLYLNYGLGAVATGNTSVIKTNMGGTTGTWTGKINLPSGVGNFRTTQGSTGTQKSFRVVTDWAAFSALTSGANNALGADIDAGNATRGHLSTITSGNSLDGLGHNISNLNITGLGLFYKVQASTIQNLGLVNIAVTANSNGPAGVLVGTVSTGAVVRNSFTTGSVNSTFTRVGGLVGLVEQGFITGSYSKATVSTTAIGALVSAGGLVGNFMIGSIANSFATGSVTANGEQVGGLIGYADPDYYSVSFGSMGNSITNSYALGNVSGTRSVGGLIGRVIYNAGAPLTLTNNYANGSVTGNLATSNAGLIGSGSNSIIRTGNYWNTTSSGQLNGMGNANVAGITGLSTAQMQDKTNFTGFEFTTNPVWFMPTAGTPLTPKLCLFEANCGIVQVYLLPVSGQSSTYGTAPTLSYCYSSSAANCSYVTFTGIPGAAVSYSLTDGLVSNNENIVGGVTGTIALTGNPSIAAAGLVSTTNARTYGLTLTPSLTLAGYSFLAGNAVDYNINKANLTQVNATKVYDRLGTVTSAQMTNITGVLGQTFSATAGTATISDANVLTANKTITSLAGLTLTSINGGLADNYFLSSNLPTAGAQNSVDISAKALAVTGITADNKVYNATTTATLTGTAAVTGVAGDVVSATGTGAGLFADKDVGTGKAVTVSGYTLTGTDAGNYSVVQPTGLTANITKAELTVSAANASKIFGEAIPTLTSVVSGFVGGESLATSGVTGAGVATTAATNATPVGTAVITAGLGNLAAGNYSFNLMNGMLTVTSVSIPDSGVDVDKFIREQIAGFSASMAGDAPASSVAQFKPAPAQTASLTSPTPVTAPVAPPRAGVLAVTILQGGEGNTTLASVAFEQNQTTTSIEASAPPSVLFKAAKVEFTDKLTTFMVAAPNGEMVEFQGGMVNNRMVIMAPSVEAKQVAQSELNLVLAAAVISLGKESRVMLAQLDGVVLDLR